jgi:hypothetical protein
MSLTPLDTSDIGAALTAVAMGVDRFERACKIGEGLLDGEGLVPIYMGDDLVEARAYKDWASVDADLAALDRAIAPLTSDARGIFLKSMVTSLKTAVRLFRGADLSYEEKVRDLVGAPTGLVDQAAIDDLTSRLDAALAKVGFVRGDLAHRVEAWEASGAIDADKLEGEFRDLMRLAKARTDAMIFDTGDYDMRLNPLRDVPFTARCGFAEKKMDLNVDQVFTRAALKHLVCHEVFPGHATQLLYTRAEVEAKRSDADALLCTANCVTGCVQEGIGDQGVQLIDWIEDRDDEIHLILRSLKSAVQTSAAWRLMVDGESAERIADYMRATAFGQDAWVKGRLRMASHPFRGPFIASYWAGNESVRRVRERVGADQRDAFIHYLYGQVQSPESLEMFETTVQ